MPTRPKTADDALALVIAAKAGAAAREGQRMLAAAVEDALATRTPLLSEAGTGVGKSYGYLVPAALWATRQARAGRPRRAGHGASAGSSDRTPAVVVATTTTALQEQLITRDLPFVTSVLAEHGVHVRTAMLKGRRNYLCRARWADKLGDDPAVGDVLTDSRGTVLADAATVTGLRAWLEQTDTGDRSEAGISEQAWSELSTSAEECPGRTQCPFAADCYFFAARDRAAAADIVVANTALYGAHLAAGGGVLPEHDTVIFDEAHRLEDVMSDALSVSLTAARLRGFAYRLRRVLDAEDIVTVLLSCAVRLTGCLEHWAGRKLPAVGDEDLDQVLDDVAVLLERAVLDLDRTPDGGAALSESARALRAQIAQQAQTMSEHVTLLRAGTDGSLMFVDDSGGAPRLTRSPVEIGPLLASRLFGQVTVVATSATLTLSGSFEPVKQRWGLTLPAGNGLAPLVETCQVPTPFRYRQQGILHVATDLPDPREEDFLLRMCQRLAELAEAAGGRTLSLFTSKSAMNAAAEHLRTHTALTVLCQGDAPREQLLEQFTSAPGHVLCAVSSYWTGVDIPGPDLSLVTIDKIPFPRRGEPLTDARRLAADRAGRNGFAEVDLPIAARELAQGVGRLIRSESDRGVVAVFDRRLARAAYARMLLDSLPDMFREARHDRVIAALHRLVADLPSAA